LSLVLLLVVTNACDGQIDPPLQSADAGAAAIDAGDDPLPGDDANSAWDAGLVPPDGAPGVVTLQSAAGCFFTVADASSSHELPAGEAGVQYSWISIDYRVTHGGWRDELFDRPVLNHGLFGMSRNVGDFVGRYILGNAAQIKPPQNNLDRKSVFYGRVDLEPRPQGEGWMGYTAWRGGTPWVEGQTYDIHILLDAVAGTQYLEVKRGADVLTQVTGDIAYFEPSLSEATYTLTFGGTESDEREVKAVGWEFCDLSVRAEIL
jgi:hypothetical protein